MKTHCRFLLILMLVATTWNAWQVTHPPTVTVFTGRPDPRVVTILRTHGAQFEVTSRGYRLACDEAGFEAIFDLMKYHQFVVEVCSENLANAHTVKTAEGIPYRRKIVHLGEDGVPTIRESRDDFNWVYDPSNPNAHWEGVHQGYVPMPNVNVLEETSILQSNQSLAESYARLLQRMEARRPDLLAFRYAPPLPSNNPEVDRAFRDLLEPQN